MNHSNFSNSKNNNNKDDEEEKIESRDSNSIDNKIVKRVMELMKFATVKKSLHSFKKKKSVRFKNSTKRVNK